jgi:hypothetical protein
MKTFWSKIERASILVMLAGAIVAVLWDIKLTNEAIEGVKALQEFQNQQDQLNAKESIVYEWALQKLMGTEIHGLEVDDEDN